MGNQLDWVIDSHVNLDCVIYTNEVALPINPSIQHALAVPGLAVCSVLEHPFSCSAAFGSGVHWPSAFASMFGLDVASRLVNN